MRRRILALSALAVLAAFPARANPVTQDPCPGAASVAVWKQLGNDVLENLLFTSDGILWISDSSAGKIRRFGSSGLEGTAAVVPNPGGMAQRADGMVYAGWGNGAANALGRTASSKVVLVDPADPAAAPTVVAQGFNMANGLTILPNGHVAVSNDFDYGLVDVDPGAGTWSELAHVWGTNGLAVVGDALFANITFDQRSPIERIPLGNPAAHTTAMQLTVGAASLEPHVYTDPDASRPLVGLKGLDDVTVKDGILYPVANGMGELLRVDPSTGAACVIAGGLQNPSSVRIAPEPGPFSDGNPATLDLYVTEFSGAIRHVVYTP